MAHGAFGYNVESKCSGFTEALQKVVNTLSRIGIKESSKPVILRTTGYNTRHLQAASKQSNVSVGALKKLIHNFNTAKIEWDSDKKKKLKESTPTNAMGQSSSSAGPIQTVDPLLKKKPLKRLKDFLKPKKV